MPNELVKITGPELVESPLDQGGLVAGTPVSMLLSYKAHAEVLADFIKKRKLYKKIGEKHHVYVEAWTFLGSMLKVFPIVAWTKPVEGGFMARVEAKTLNGQVVGAAEAQCLRTEQNWKNRDDYALLSMAQTRATSKALRLPLGFIMLLAGFEATPAEEMTPDYTEALQASIDQVKASKAAKGTKVAPEPPKEDPGPSTEAEGLPEKCYCGGRIRVYFSTQKEHLNRAYLQCEAAHDRIEEAIIDGATPREAAVANSRCYRAWAPKG